MLTDYNEEFLAFLEPHNDGSMKMVPYQSHQMVNYFSAPNVFSGSNEIELVFNLHTIQPDGKHVPLQWVTGSTVLGNLRSRSLV